MLTLEIVEPSLFDKFSDEKGMKIRCMFETFASGGEGERTLMTWSMGRTS